MFLFALWQTRSFHIVLEVARLPAVGIPKPVSLAGLLSRPPAVALAGLFGVAGNGLLAPGSLTGIGWFLLRARAYVLLVGLDVADLAAVGALPGGARDLFSRGLGRALITGGAAVPHLLLELLLFLALLTSLFVLFQSLLFDAGSVQRLAPRSKFKQLGTYFSRMSSSFSGSPVSLTL
jgi:hypothetical protein